MPILVEPTIHPGQGAHDHEPTLVMLGDSGIILGEVDEHGVMWGAAEGTVPWSPKPAVRGVTGDRSNGHGVWDGSRFHAARTLGFSGSVRAPNHTALHNAYGRLNAAVGLEGFELRVIEPGFDRSARVRQSDEVLWTEKTTVSASYTITLLAPDPLIYSTAPHVASTPFPSVSGGLSWPATWPATWDAEVTSGTVTLTNAGSQPAPLSIHVAGGALDDLVVYSPGVGSLTVENPDGPLLGSGQEWLDIDTARRQVVLLDTGYRRSWARGDWLMVPGNSSIEVSVGSSTPTSARVYFTNHDVWI